MPKATDVNHYKKIIETNIAGIPAKIGVVYYNNVPAWRRSPHSCNSDYDYYGYIDIEYDVLDRKGYHAGWIEKKINNDIKLKIEREIIEAYDE
jgi:hypothetical protein